MANINEPNGYGVIWDVDGTLVDTAAQHFAAWEKLGQDLGQPFTQEHFVATFGRRNPEIIRYLFGEDLTTEQVDDYGFRKEEYYREIARAGIDLLPGVRNLLNGLYEAGFKQAIGSSGPHQNLAMITEATGTRRYFDAIVGMEDTERGKPDPQVFLVAAERMGIDPAKCLVFEDAVAGIQAATAAGMKSIAVTFVGHHSGQSLSEAGASHVVQSLVQVSVATVRQILNG